MNFASIRELTSAGIERDGTIHLGADYKREQIGIVTAKGDINAEVIWTGEEKDVHLRHSAAQRSLDAMLAQADHILSRSRSSAAHRELLVLRHRVSEEAKIVLPDRLVLDLEELSERQARSRAEVVKTHCEESLWGRASNINRKPADVERLKERLAEAEDFLAGLQAATMHERSQLREQDRLLRSAERRLEQGILELQDLVERLTPMAFRTTEASPVLSADRSLPATSASSDLTATDHFTVPASDAAVGSPPAPDEESSSLINTPAVAASSAALTDSPGSPAAPPEAQLPTNIPVIAAEPQQTVAEPEPPQEQGSSTNFDGRKLLMSNAPAVPSRDTKKASSQTIRDGLSKLIDDVIALRHPIAFVVEASGGRYQVNGFNDMTLQKPFNGREKAYIRSRLEPAYNFQQLEQRRLESWCRSQTSASSQGTATEDQAAIRTLKSRWSKPPEAGSTMQKLREFNACRGPKDSAGGVEAGLGQATLRNGGEVGRSSGRMPEPSADVKAVNQKQTEQTELDEALIAQALALGSKLKGK